MNNIRKLRKEMRLSQAELAEKLNVSQSAVSGWEVDRYAITYPDLKKMAELFGVSIDYLMGNDITRIAPTITDDVVSFPIVGEVAAGYDQLPDQMEGERIDIPSKYLHGRPSTDYFILRIKSDSMHPVFQDGDLILVLKQSSCDHSGEVAVVIYNDEAATIKRVEYIVGQDWMRLIPLNPHYPTIKIEGESLEHCRVLGIPKLLIREIEP